MYRGFNNLSGCALNCTPQQTVAQICSLRFVINMNEIFHPLQAQPCSIVGQPQLSSTQGERKLSLSIHEAGIVVHVPFGADSSFRCALMMLEDRQEKKCISRQLYLLKSPGQTMPSKQVVAQQVRQNCSRRSESHSYALNVFIWIVALISLLIMIMINDVTMSFMSTCRSGVEPECWANTHGWTGTMLLIHDGIENQISNLGELSPVMVGGR